MASFLNDRYTELKNDEYGSLLKYPGKYHYEQHQIYRTHYLRYKAHPAGLFSAFNHAHLSRDLYHDINAIAMFSGAQPSQSAGNSWGNINSKFSVSFRKLVSFS